MSASPRRIATLAIITSLALVGGCGYFNSLYNAEHRFAAAQRAEALGDRSGAISNYEEAIRRAAVSYQNFPKSRWADDALLLIGRSHFGTGSDRQAVAALQRLLIETRDETIRTQAYAYLGAARARMRDPEASAALDSAVAGAPEGSEVAAFSHLWRARARFFASDVNGAWEDLDKVPFALKGIGADASMERLMRATVNGDSTRWLREVTRFNVERTPPRWADSVRALFAPAAARWGSQMVYAALPPTVGHGLPEEDRLQVQLARAELAAGAGDTATAITDGMRIANASSSETALLARIRTAQWMLGTAKDPSEFGRIRAVLLPAFSNGEALALMQQLRALEIMVDRSANDPVAMFVAAEFARDELRAPRVARSLFIRFEALPTRTTWDGKALLAALDLSASDAERDAVRARLAAHGRDAYIDAATAEGDSAAFASAESTLRRESTALRAEAAALAREQDVSVNRALFVRDSVRRILQRDSLVARCGVVMDSIAARGIRADSLRVACLRSDSARFNAVLRIDTMKLKPPRADTMLTPFSALSSRPSRMKPRR